MKDVKQIIDGIITVEGDYTFNAADAGGATKYGITEKTARAHGYTGDMKYLPREVAYDIYLQAYWKAPAFDKVAELSDSIATELCDTGVNCGVETAKPLLQRALNALNRQQTDYADVVVDGQLGPATMLALARYLAKRGSEGERILLKLLNCMQGYHYLEISERRPANETFLYGWIANRVS